MSESKVSRLDAAGPAAKDKVFAKPGPPGDFKFSAEVASVFDDMVGRSAPYYDEMQRMTAELAPEFAVEGSSL